MKVKLTTTAAKPEDPPIAEFDAKVPALGPQEVKDASGTATTKLRVYELPDWQFLKADAEITSPRRSLGVARSAQSQYRRLASATCRGTLLSPPIIHGLRNSRRLRSQGP